MFMFILPQQLIQGMRYEEGITSFNLSDPSRTSVKLCTPEGQSSDGIHTCSLCCLK